MTMVWIYSIVSVLIISLISMVGTIILAIKKAYIKPVLLFFISFAAGALLGDVFIHLLPELINKGDFKLQTSLGILAGILIFFVMEKILNWRHCHMTADPHHVHPLAHMNLVGDVFHNFVDGMVIAASYLVSIQVGLATTIAVVLHEIPQEMGDFGILLHTGMTAKKALFFNFVSALTAFLGALFVLIFTPDPAVALHFIIPLVIGGFLYIASADLIPELHKDVEPRKSLIQLLSLMAGIGIMGLLLFVD